MMTLTKNFLDLTAQDLMSKEVISIPARMTLRSAAHLLLHSQISGAPVVDEWNRCVGVISGTDFVRWVEKEPGPEGVTRPSQATPYCAEWQVAELEQVPNDEVRLYMTKDPVTVHPETPISELARAMLDAHIHRVVVVDENRHPVGIITATDILAAVAYREGAIPSPN